jgi:hypothetical protein
VGRCPDITQFETSHQYVERITVVHFSGNVLPRQDEFKIAPEEVTVRGKLSPRCINILFVVCSLCHTVRIEL